MAQIDGYDDLIQPGGNGGHDTDIAQTLLDEAHPPVGNFERIHVFDALGKQRVVLHHTDIDGSEPCTINEEWMNREVPNGPSSGLIV